MNIETELIHKWGIGDDPVFGSGSLKDIQTLCNECDKLRKENERMESELRQETMRVDWLLARQYDHKTRESVDAAMANQ